MTVSSVVKMWSRDGAQHTLSSDGKKRTVSIKEAYQVITTADATQAEVLSATGLPRVGSYYAGFPYLACLSHSPSRVSPVFWIVEVSFQGEAGLQDATDSPLNKPPEISWSDAESDEATDEDYDGNPIVTVNGEPIEGVTLKLADPVVTIRRNLLTFNPFAMALYRHSVNSDSFLGFPPGTARLTKLQAKQVAATKENPRGYWDVTGTIQFRRGLRTTDAKAWYARVRHEGFYEKLADGSIVRAVDANKEPVSKPVMLKSDGTRETDAEKAHWLEFKKYGSLPYRTLGLI